MTWGFLAAVSALLCVQTLAGAKSFENARTFTVDYEHKTFLLDGKPFRYVSGGFHYFRVPHEYWEDRLSKMAAAGLDAVQTYVAWNMHESNEGVYDFEGQNNIGKFLELAKKYNLYVILRPGPYICAEWDYGGFPAWLLSTNESMAVRTSDQRYMDSVKRWLSKLLPVVRPYLLVNGGPIIMVQVENEYGSFGCDRKYMNEMASILSDYLGDETFLFTTDGNSKRALTCGTSDKAFPTVDFGTVDGPDDVSKAFECLKNFSHNKGPLVNSELYTGWIDTWGERHSRVNTKKLIETLRQIENLNASLNMYMFEGGTSFGFMNGGNAPNYWQITSYDYDSPLSESGDITEKYLAIRNFTSRYKPNLPPVPKNVEKKAYGEIEMKKAGSVLELLDILSAGKSVASHVPLPMEHIHHYYGFIMYRHIFKSNFPSDILKVPGLRDRGYVLLDGQRVAILEVEKELSFLMSADEGQVLDIVVENHGRFNYGDGLNHNNKGIIENVTLGNSILTGWTMYPIDVSNIFNNVNLVKTPLSSSQSAHHLAQPTIYMGSFKVEQGSEVKDTFVDMCGWTRGVMYVNGHNLGRYRPTLGPQTTFYLPAPFLKPFPEENTVVVLELERVVKERVTSVDAPQLDNKCFA